jgi:hypothetical protein
MPNPASAASANDDQYGPDQALSLRMRIAAAALAVAWLAVVGTAPALQEANEVTRARCLAAWPAWARAQNPPIDPESLLQMTPELGAPCRCHATTLSGSTSFTLTPPSAD